MATDLITARPCHPVLPAHFRLAIRARKSGNCASYVCAPANTAIDIGLWPVRVAHAVARVTPVPAAVRSRKQRCWVRKVQRRARVVAIRQHRELRMRRGQRGQIGSVPPRRPGLALFRLDTRTRNKESAHLTSVESVRATHAPSEYCGTGSPEQLW